MAVIDVFSISTSLIVIIYLPQINCFSLKSIELRKEAPPNGSEPLQIPLGVYKDIVLSFLEKKCMCVHKKIYT